MEPTMQMISHEAIGGGDAVTLLVESIAVIVGFIAVYLLLRLNTRLGGKINAALRFFILGVLSNVLAIVLSELGYHQYAFGTLTIDIHHVLMAIGMIFFVISTRRFSSLISNE